MSEQPGEIQVAPDPVVSDDQRRMAAGALLSIAQDEDVSPALRLQAARLVLYGPADDPYAEVYEEPEAEEAPDEQDVRAAESVLIEKLAQRVVELIREKS